MNVINQESLDSLEVDRIRQRLDEETYAIVRGVFDVSKVMEIRENIKRNLDQANDIKHDPRDLASAKKNMQKLLVGGSTSGSPRFVRKYYNPLFNEDVYSAHSILKKLIEFRNLIYGKSRDFALYSVQEGAWSCPMIAHYPRGGGFMAQHRDARAHTNAVDLGMDRFVQVILIMSEKGKDFISGGAYIVKNDERIYYEDECRIGDVVMYDGRNQHGVEEIDALERLDLNSPEGRYIAMAPLFKELNSFDELIEVGKRIPEELR